MKVSLITVTLNDKEGLSRTIRSVAAQTFPDIEHIIIDGGSTDGTRDILDPYRGTGRNLIVSEPDHGSYDAMNKGIALASGEIIGFLHAGDVFCDTGIVARIVATFEKNGVEATYGNIIYHHPIAHQRTVRVWTAGPFDRERIRGGWMPPHPSVYLKKSLYEKFGTYRLDLSIAADYELMLRLFYCNGVVPAYIDEPLISMRNHGRSNRDLGSIIRSNYEAWKSWRLNGLKPSPLLFLRKPLSKIAQIVRKERRLDHD